jgi:uncharacterized membrane protein YoaK (UPF0700 family)
VSGRAGSLELALLPVLALAAGSLDAISYLGLGQVFTANMTGNTVLLGVAVARGSGAAALRSAIAVAGFCVGAALGTAVTLRRGSWPRSAVAGFAAEVALVAGLAALWLVLGAHGEGRTHVLILFSAGAMGAQSAASRLAPVDGVNTTFITGTLTNAIARAVGALHPRPEARSAPREAALPSGVWLVYGIGGLGGALLERATGGWAAFLPLCLVGFVTLAARVRSSPALDGSAR